MTALPPAWCGVRAGGGHRLKGDVRVYSTSASESVGFNKFTYIGPAMTALGTNNAAVASGEAASAGKGTDFGALLWGSALTNTFAITNSGNTNLTISAVTTNGARAAAFSISDPAGGGINFPFSITASTASNWTVRFAPPNAGTYTASVQIANNSTTTPYIVYLAGIGAKLDQTITSFMPTNGSAFTTTSVVGVSAQASSGLPVTNFTVASGPGSISGLTNLTFTGSGSVSIAASQPGNTNWNAAPAVSNTFNVLPAPATAGWLAIQVTPASGFWALSAPMGYTGPASGTGNLAAVSAVTGQYSLVWGALSGYVALSNQSRFVTAGNTLLFTGVYLLVSTKIGTPAGVSATEGTYTNRIRVIWQGVDGATGYEIWRSQTTDADTAGRIADVPDNSPLLIRISEDPNGRAKPPWLGVASERSRPAEPQNNGRLTGDGSPYLQMSYVGMGYAALNQAQAQGTADIAVSDLVFLPVNVVVRHLGALNDPDLANNTTAAAGSVRIKILGANSPGRSFNDYDGDGKADPAVYHQATPS